MCREYFTMGTKDYVILPHAVQRMGERNISVARIIQVLNEGMCREGQTKWARECEKNAVRVVYEPNKNPIEIISVMYTNKWSLVSNTHEKKIHTNQQGAK